MGHFTDGQFTIERVRVSDEGEYECVPSNIYGPGRIATLHLAVVGKYGNKILIQDLVNMTIEYRKKYCKICMHLGKVVWSYLG